MFQQHIAAAWPASSYTSAAVAPPTYAVYSVQNFTHVCVIHVKSQDYISGLALSVT